MKSANAFNLDQSTNSLFGKESTSLKFSQVLNKLTHSLIHHFETVQNSKKLQMTIEMWLLKDFMLQIAKKTLWKKVKMLRMSNFTFFHNFSKVFFFNVFK